MYEAYEATTALLKMRTSMLRAFMAAKLCELLAWPRSAARLYRSAT